MVYYIVFIRSTILTVNFRIITTLKYLSVFDLVRTVTYQVPVGGFMCVNLLRLLRVDENISI